MRIKKFIEAWCIRSKQRKYQQIHQGNSLAIDQRVDIINANCWCVHFRLEHRRQRRYLYYKSRGVCFSSMTKTSWIWKRTFVLSAKVKIMVSTFIIALASIVENRNLLYPKGMFSSWKKMELCICTWKKLQIYLMCIWPLNWIWNLMESKMMMKRMLSLMHLTLKI